MLILMNFCIFWGLQLLKMKIQLLQNGYFWDSEMVKIDITQNLSGRKIQCREGLEKIPRSDDFFQKMKTVYHNSCNCPSWSLKALKVSRIGEGIFQLLYDKGNIQRWVESSVKAKGVSRTNSIKKKMMSYVLFGRNLGNIWIDFWSQKDIFKGVFFKN